jgi:cytochrome c biogenesis protein CcmG/thiol:disulfide interchange protein DsbE
VTTPQKNAIVLVVVALVVAGMIYTGAKHSRRVKPFDDQGGLQGDLRGKEAPDFELKTLDGKKVKLSELRGKAVVVNFWATWCGPCKLEMPWLVDLQTKYADKGLVILGLSVDEGSSDKIASFAKDMGVNYPVLRSTDEVSNLYGGIDGLPTTFYVGRDGKVIEQAAGLVSKDVIEDGIRLALAHGAVPSTASTELSNAQKDSKTKQ